MKYFILLAMITSCSSTEEKKSAIYAKIKKRAAFDMKCKENNLQVTEIDNTTYGVTGCDQQATYLAYKNGSSSCYGFERVSGITSACKIILNTDGRNSKNKD